MKISHEVPLCLLQKSKEFNDYDYALVHLFNSHPEYYRFFRDSLKEGREVILDNSLYELGEAFNMKEYYKWIIKLNPAYYVIPDKFFDSGGSRELLDEWLDRYSCLTNSKTIGVVHGEDYRDMAVSYIYTHKQVDKVAFTFKFHKNMLPSLVGEIAATHIRDIYDNSTVDSITRILLLSKLDDDGILDKSKPHHLLGCQNLYGLDLLNKFDWIDSIDTSNPVMYGYSKYYERDFYENVRNDLQKPAILLKDIFDVILTDQQLNRILSNIKTFRNYLVKQ